MRNRNGPTLQRVSWTATGAVLVYLVPLSTHSGDLRPLYESMYSMQMKNNDQIIGLDSQRANRSTYFLRNKMEQAINFAELD